MGQSADQIRQEIEETRSDLGQTIDAISDRVRPKRIVRRRTARIRHGFTSMREAVMGKAEDAGNAVGSAAGNVSSGVGSAADSARESASSAVSTVAGGVESAAQSVADAARETPHVVTRQTRGNPLAAGLVAFGAGLVVASALPATDKERRLASTVSDELAPVGDAARQAGEELKGELTSTARQAAEAVKERAKDATEELTSEAQSAAEQVREQATGATSEVADQARDAAQRVSSSSGSRGGTHEL